MPRLTPLRSHASNAADSNPGSGSEQEERDAVLTDGSEQDQARSGQEEQRLQNGGDEEGGDGEREQDNDLEEMTEAEAELEEVGADAQEVTTVLAKLVKAIEESDEAISRQWVALVKARMKVVQSAEARRNMKMKNKSRAIGKAKGKGRSSAARSEDVEQDRSSHHQQSFAVWA